MAIAVISDTFDDTTLQLTWRGYVGTRSFKISGLSAIADNGSRLVSALTVAGIPRLGDGFPGSLGIFCNKLIPKMLDDSDIAMVTATYEPAGSATLPVPKWGDPPRLRGGVTIQTIRTAWPVEEWSKPTDERQELTVFYKPPKLLPSDPEPKTESAVVQFDLPLPMATRSIARIELGAPEVTADLFVGAVNLTDWVNWPADQGLCTSIDYSVVGLFTDGQLLWDVEYNFQKNPLGWNASNVGYFAVNGVIVPKGSTPGATGRVYFNSYFGAEFNDLGINNWHDVLK